jgi:hypothetical protein
MSGAEGTKSSVRPWYLAAALSLATIVTTAYVNHWLDWVFEGSGETEKAQALHATISERMSKRIHSARAYARALKAEDGGAPDLSQKRDAYDDVREEWQANWRQWEQDVGMAFGCTPSGNWRRIHEAFASIDRKISQPRSSLQEILSDINSLLSKISSSNNDIARRIATGKIYRARDNALAASSLASC